MSSQGVLKVSKNYFCLFELVTHAHVQTNGVRCSPLPPCKGKGCFSSLRVGHLGYSVRMFPKLGNFLVRFYFYFFSWHWI